jgi:hypothetical protein
MDMNKAELFEKHADYLNKIKVLEEEAKRTTNPMFAEQLSRAITGHREMLAKLKAEIEEISS